MRMRVQVYEMTDEELEIFNNKFVGICELIDGMPAHLITPLLLRLTISTYLNLKGFEKTDASIQLAHSLVSELTDVIVTKTTRNITERN